MKIMQMKYSLSVLVAAAAMSAAAAFAEQAATPGPVQPGTGNPVANVAQPAADAGSPFTFDADVKWVNAYFSRGYDYGDSGLFLQPEATVGWKAYKSGDVSITPWFNAWANVTDKRDDGVTYTNMNYWDELDLTPAVDLTIQRFTFSFQYIYYTSPADNWGDIHELGLTTSFDDTDLLHLPFAFNPYFSIYKEIINQDTSVRGYMEAGIKPKISPVKDVPFSLQFPLAIGMNLHDFYYDRDGEQTFLGYGSLGVVAQYNLTDHWYINGGLKWIHDIAYSAKQSHDDGNPDALVTSLAIGCSF